MHTHPFKARSPAAWRGQTALIESLERQLLSVSIAPRRAVRRFRRRRNREFRPLPPSAPLGPNQRPERSGHRRARALAGSASYDAPSDTTTLTGSGADIYGTSDQFNFASRAVAGDAGVLAYVNSITNTDPWAKAGVMFRVDSSADSAFAGVFVSPSNGIVFEWRTTAGQTSCSRSRRPAVPRTRPSRSSSRAAATISPRSTRPIRSSGCRSAKRRASSCPQPCSAESHHLAQQRRPRDGGILQRRHWHCHIAGTAPAAGLYSSADQLFLDDLEHREFEYFYDEANANTGLIPDLSNANGGGASVAASIAAQGFGLTGMTIADARLDHPRRGLSTH